MAGGKTSFNNKTTFCKILFLNSNRHTLNTLPMYDYIGNRTTSPISPNINNHAIINSWVTNTFILVNTKVKQDPKFTLPSNYSAQEQTNIHNTYM